MLSIANAKNCLCLAETDRRGREQVIMLAHAASMPRLFITLLRE